jgi:hypothetical protein
MQQSSEFFYVFKYEPDPGISIGARPKSHRKFTTKRKLFVLFQNKHEFILKYPYFHGNQ